jgi:hypothetical protein
VFEILSSSIVISSEVDTLRTGRADADARSERPGAAPQTVVARDGAGREPGLRAPASHGCST